MLSKNNFNLYAALPKEYQNRITIKSCVQIVSLIVSMLCVVNICFVVAIKFKQSELLSRQAIKVKSRIELEKVKKEHPTITIDTELSEKIAALREEKNAMQAILSEISKERYSNVSGFSKFFKLLAKHSLENLWLTEFNIQKGGAHIIIKGLTNNVALVQQLVELYKRDDLLTSTRISLKRLETTSNENATDEFVIEVMANKTLVGSNV